MSSLIFCTEPNQVLVATDTLATSPDGRPLYFTTKAFVVPHLRTLIAGTGAGGFLGTWFAHINGMALRGIDNLDYHTQRNLAALWRDHKQKFSSLPDNYTATVYHFGFSELTGLIHSFAYRSTTDFLTEPFGYGTGVKPPCAFPEDCRFPDGVRKIMDQQRVEQSFNPNEERIYIGGEIQIHHLSKDGCHVYTLDRFEEYLSDEKVIYDNFR